jgi:hypothetical protein
MSALDEILAHYEKRNEPVSPERKEELSSEASQHLVNYLCGDGDVTHLHGYYECLEKIN